MVSRRGLRSRGPSLMMDNATRQVEISKYQQQVTCFGTPTEFMGGQVHASASGYMSIYYRLRQATRRKGSLGSF